MQKPLAWLRKRDPDRTVRMRARRWVRPRIRVQVAPLIVGGLFMLGIALILGTACRLLFTRGSQFSALPVPVSECAVYAHPCALPSYTASILSADDLPYLSSAGSPVVSDTAPRSYLVVRNGSTMPVRCIAGSSTFPLSPGAEIRLHMSPGWSDLRAEAPGTPGFHRRVYFLPYETYVCTFCLGS